MKGIHIDGNMSIEFSSDYKVPTNMLKGLKEEQIKRLPKINADKMGMLNSAMRKLESHLLDHIDMDDPEAI